MKLTEAIEKGSQGYKETYRKFIEVDDQHRPCGICVLTAAAIGAGFQLPVTIADTEENSLCIDHMLSFMRKRFPALKHEKAGFAICDQYIIMTEYDNSKLSFAEIITFIKDLDLDCDAADV